MVKKLVFISILIMFLSINMVAAEDISNATVDVSQSDDLDVEQVSTSPDSNIEVGTQVNNTVGDASITIENVVLNTSDVRIFNKGESYNATLTYDDGTPAWNQSIVFDINGVKYTKVTNNSGFAGLNINLNQGTYVISASFTDSYNRTITHYNHVYVSDVEGTIIPEGLSNIEIQKIIDSANAGDNLIFAGKTYDNISLTINNRVNIYSSVKSVLNGNGINPVFTIKSSKAAGTIIYNLAIKNGLYGILLKGTTGVNITNNEITGNGEGIRVSNTDNSYIFGNTISNSKNYGIYLENSNNINIKLNNISNNGGGIYFGKKALNTKVLDNSITQNKDYGINLNESGSYTTITGNTVNSNGNGININCTGDDELAISNNEISYNGDNGIYIGEGYVRTSGLKGVEYNVLFFNTYMNILARDSNYNRIDIGPVLVQSSNSAFTGICNKVRTTLLSLNVKQEGKNTVIISVDGITKSFGLGVSQGGKTFAPVTISNGQGVVHVTNADGTITLNYITGTSRDTFTLSGYEPYSNSGYPKPPSDSGKSDGGKNLNNPVNPGSSDGQKINQDSENGTSSNTQENQGSASASGSGGLNEATLSVFTASSSVASQGSSSSEDSSSSSDSSSGGSSSSSDSSGEDSSSSSDSSSDDSSGLYTSAPASSSNSVAKAINIDEEVVRIAGLSILILLIIVVVGLYYRNDIKSMIEKKNGK